MNVLCVSIKCDSADNYSSDDKNRMLGWFNPVFPMTTTFASIEISSSEISSSFLFPSCFDLSSAYIVCAYPPSATARRKPKVIKKRKKKKRRGNCNGTGW